MGSTERMIKTLYIKKKKFGLFRYNNNIAKKEISQGHPLADKSLNQIEQSIKHRLSSGMIKVIEKKRKPLTARNLSAQKKSIY